MTTNAPSRAHSPIGYSQLIRHNANFRNLWFGQIVSLLGDWFNLIASAALVSQLTHSGLANVRSLSCAHWHPFCSAQSPV